MMCGRVVTANVLSQIAQLDFGTENPYRVFNTMVNNLFFDVFHLHAAGDYVLKQFGEEAGYYVQCYLRDLIMGTMVYWLTAGIWHFFIYVLFKKSLYTDKARSLPTTAIIVDQICLAQSSLFMYAGLPILSEYFIESGITHTYFYVKDIGGWGNYFLFLFLYMVFVEIGVYWVHRTLHENKFLYKYVHGLHHKYNSAETLTPWASIAFNPIDGLLQASPYVVGLFIVPVHYFTHVFLLFFSGVWATNIHDAMVSYPFLKSFNPFYSSMIVIYSGETQSQLWDPSITPCTTLTTTTILANSSSLLTKFLAH
jgi:lathosterol oxidase